jgi:hypothetical protein
LSLGARLIRGEGPGNAIPEELFIKNRLYKEISGINRGEDLNLPGVRSGHQREV